MNVSIIIPVYNVAPYVEACLRSVMLQTYSGSMECLVVDDCGTDDSISIIQHLLANYVGPIQFRILHHEHNRGLSAARNTGTEAAIGEYLYYMDSDDEITPDCIEFLMEKVKQYPEVEMVQGGTFRHYRNGTEEVWPQNVLIPYADSNEAVRTCFYHLGQLYITVWNKLLKREFVVANGIYCKEGLLYEDHLWVFYLVKYLKRAAFINDTTYLYAQRRGSITFGYDGSTLMIRSFITTYEVILTHLTLGFEKEEFGYYAERIIGSYFDYIHVTPQFNEVMRRCWILGRRYGSWRFRIRLTIIYFLGRFKHGSEMWEMVRIITHPGLVFEDIKHLFFHGEA